MWVPKPLIWEALKLILGAQTSHFGGLEAPFWHPGGPFRRSWSPLGHLAGHLGRPSGNLVDFGAFGGTSGDPLWGNFGDFFVIWASNVAVQVPG